MSTQFKRDAKLTLGDLDVTGLRFGFTIEKSSGREPNKANISVWNLSEDNRSKLERADELTVVLEAGYEGSTWVLFKGDVREINSTHDGTEWITTMNSGDGERAMKRSRTNRSVRGGVSVQKLAQDLAKDLGVGLGNLNEALTLSLGLSGIKDIGPTLSHGVTPSGSAANQLDSILDAAGLTYSIQDGEIQAVRRGEGVPTLTVLLTEGSGLIGTPSVDEKGRLEARSLLNPGLVVNALVTVESSTAKGLWWINKLRYVGDMYSAEWFAEIEGRPV